MDQIPVDRYPAIAAYPLQEYPTETNPVLRLWAARPDRAAQIAGSLVGRIHQCFCSQPYRLP